jgi:hypothetical protein
VNSPNVGLIPLVRYPGMFLCKYAYDVTHSRHDVTCSSSGPRLIYVCVCICIYIKSRARFSPFGLRNEHVSARDCGVCECA